MPKPSIGLTVHYIGHTTQVCHAAIITAVDEYRADRVDLFVLDWQGLRFARSVVSSTCAETPGHPDCPQQEAHGNPFRYCECGWREPAYKPNTWHWPEEVG